MELVIEDAAGEVIRTFTRKAEPDEEETPPLGDDDRVLTADAGLNRFEWDLRYPGVERFEKLVLWNNSLDGPRAVPGDYRAVLTVGDEELAADLRVVPDPRSQATPAALQQQFDFVWGVNRKLTETHQAITRLRQARDQVAAVAERVGDSPAFAGLAG
mgnify:CR=1 FL=1